MEPISIHIPPQLRHLAISPSEFCKFRLDCDRLVVGACIFRQLPGADLTMLLIQRASTERAFPNKWEVPGGSGDDTDPTIFHAVAREIFEETGLHLTRIVREVIPEITFIGATSGMKSVKLTFDIEVSEFKHPSAGKGCSESLRGPDPKEMKTVGTSVAENENEVLVNLNSDEHQNFRWATEANIRNPDQRAEKMTWVKKDQQETMLTAFELHRRAENASAEQTSTQSEEAKG